MKKKLLIEQSVQENAFAKDWPQASLKIQEETFRTISQEIHDNIGQSLTLLKLKLAMTKPENNKQVIDTLEDSNAMLTSTIQDLRNLAHSLNPEFLASLGLSSAIERLLNQIEKTGRYQISFSSNTNTHKTNIQKDLVLLRIVQELLNNIIKHAQATSISLVVKYSEDHLTITISDNGIGFDVDSYSTTKEVKGIGLSNMQNRIKLIAGELIINSTLGKGTVVSIRI